MTDNGKDVVDVPAPERKGRSRKPKQEHLPGQEPQPKIAAIHQAIEAYVEVRDERMRLTEQEVQKRTLLGEVTEGRGGAGRGGGVMFRCSPGAGGGE